jgi:hypothetical protein
MNEPRNTGSEEERNPYDLKELFIEACAREWREEYFSEIVGRNGLEAMSMLDSLEDLEVGAPLYSGPDLFTSLQHDVSSRSREKWLFKEVCLALQDPYLRTAIDTLLDKDLEAAGMLSLMGLGKRLADKVSIHNYLP